MIKEKPLINFSGFSSLDTALSRYDVEREARSMAFLSILPEAEIGILESTSRLLAAKFMRKRRSGSSVTRLSEARAKNLLLRS